MSTKATYDFSMFNEYSSDKEGFDFSMFEDVKKKDLTFEEFQSTARGSSEVPSQAQESLKPLDSGVLSTTQNKIKQEAQQPTVDDQEVERDELESKLLDKIDYLYTNKGELTPRMKIERFQEQQGNLLQRFQEQSEVWVKDGISPEEINKRYKEKIDSLMSGLGLVESDGRIVVPEEDINKFSDIVSKASELVVEDVNTQARQELIDKYKDQGFWEENWKALKSGTYSEVVAGIAGLKPLFADTMFEWIEKPILKAQGKDEAYINAVRQSIDLRDGGDIGARRTIAKLAKDEAAAIESTMKVYEQSIIDNIADGNWGTATRQITKSVTQSLPIMIAAGVSGGATAEASLATKALTSLSTLGTVSASSRYLDVKDEELMPEAYGKQLANAWLYGGLEATGEIFTMGIFGNMVRSLKGLSTDVLKKTSKTIALSFSKEVLGEGVSEGFVTELGQQLVDLVQGNRENIDFKQIGDAVIVGSAAVAPMAGITATSEKIKASRIATKEDIQKVNENIANLNDLAAKKKDLDSKEEKDIINEEMNTLINENQEIFDKNEKIAKNLSTKEFAKVQELTERINTLDEEIATKSEEGMSTVAEEALLNNLLGKRDDLLTKSVAEEVLQEEGKPKYSIDGIEYESKEDFLQDVEKFSTKEGSPNIKVDNDEATTKQVADILQQKVEEGTLESDTGTKEDIKTETTTEEKEVVKTPKKQPETDKQIDELKKQDDVQEQEKIQDEALQEKEELQEEEKVDKKQKFTDTILKNPDSLRGLQVKDEGGRSLKLSEKQAALQNIIDGKETKQAKALESAINEAYDRGGLELVAEAAGSKTSREFATVDEFIERVGTDEVVDPELEARKTEIPQEELERMQAEEDLTKTEPIAETKEEGTIKIPKGKKAISERFKSQESKTRGKNTLSYKIVDEQSSKSKYSQLESKKSGEDLIKKHIDEDGNIDQKSIEQDIARVNTPGVANFAYAALERLYRALSLNEELSNEQRLHWERKASEIVYIMSERALGQGRDVVSWKIINEENPSLDARVRLAEALKKTDNEILSQEQIDGKTKGEVLESIKEEVKQELQSEIDKILKENRQLQETVRKLKEQTKKSIKKQGEELAEKIRRAKVPKDLMFSTIVPIQAIWNPSMEVIAQSVKVATAAAQEVVDMAKIIKEAVQDGLDWIKKQKWYNNLTEEEKARFDEFYKRKARETIEKQESVDDVIKKHYADNTDPRSLVEKLMEDADLSRSQANKIKNIIAKEVKKRVRQKLIEVNERYGIEKKGWRDRFLTALSEGDIRDAIWMEGFKDKFGLSGFSQEAANTVKLMAEAINVADSKREKFLARQIALDLSNLLKKYDKKDVWSLLKSLNDWQYSAVLTGLNTIYNAWIGGGVSLAVESIPRLISKGVLPTIFGATMGTKFIKTHIKEFMEVVNTNRGYFDNLGIMDESYTPKGEGAVEMLLSSPFFSYTSDFLKTAKDKVQSKDAELAQGFMKDWLLHTVAKAAFVNSVIKAQDALFRGHGTDILAAADEFVDVAKEMGMKGIGKDFKIIGSRKLADVWTQAMKNLAMDKVSTKEIKKQVNSEIEARLDKGEELPRNYRSRREYELRVQKGNTERYEYNMQDVTDMIMLGNPDGVPGWLYKGLTEKTGSLLNSDSNVSKAGAMAIKFTLLFTRMTMNSIGAAIRNVPVVGIIPSVVGLYHDQLTGRMKFGIKQDKHQRTRRIATNIAITGATMMMFMDMFEWDDEDKEFKLDPDRNWDFTSFGYGSWKENQRHGITTNFGFRHRKKDGTWGQWHGAYLSPHLMPAIGFLGRWSDDLKGVATKARTETLLERQAVVSKEEKDWIKKTKAITQSLPDITEVTLRSMAETQYNPVGRSVKKMQYAKDRNLGIMNGLFSIVSDPAKSILQPAIVRDIINEGYRLGEVDKKEYDKSFADQTLKGFYIYDMFVRNEQLDLYGNTIPRDSKLWSFKSKYIQKYKDYPEYKLLDKYENLKRPATYWMPSSKEYDIDEKMEARRYAKTSFGYYVKGGLDFLNTLNQKDLELALETYWDLSTQDATYAIDYKQANPDLTDEEIDKQYIKFRISNAVANASMETALKGYNIDIEKIKSDFHNNLVKTKAKAAVKKL
jgi:hypothetical protein